MAWGTDLEVLAVQYREAHLSWGRAFLARHTAPEAEQSARATWHGLGRSLDAAAELAFERSPTWLVDALLRRAFEEAA